MVTFFDNSLTITNNKLGSRAGRPILRIRRPALSTGLSGFREAKRRISGQIGLTGEECSCCPAIGQETQQKNEKLRKGEKDWDRGKKDMNRQKDWQGDGEPAGEAMK